MKQTVKFIIFIILIILLILIIIRKIIIRKIIIRKINCKEDTKYDKYKNYQKYKQKHIKIDIGPFITPKGKKIFVYNPSIEIDDKGDIIGLSRLTGKTFSDCKKSFHNYKDNKNINDMISQYPNEYQSEISSIIIWNFLDFEILNTFSIDNLCKKEESLKSAIKGDVGQGIEDCRLFKFKRDLWVYGHFRGNYKGRCVHNPIIFKIKEPNNIIILYKENMREIEKNWMPFEFQNELYFEYDINPHTILKCDILSGYCKTVFSSDNIKTNPISKNLLGGGSPPKEFYINEQKYYLGLGHTRGDIPVRKNFFYIFRTTPPFDIIMIGKEFDIVSKDIEFGSGMVIKDNTVIISCGISDCYSLLSEISLEEIINSLSIL